MLMNVEKITLAARRMANEQWALPQLNLCGDLIKLVAERDRERVRKSSLTCQTWPHSKPRTFSPLSRAQSRLPTAGRAAGLKAVCCALELILKSQP